MASQASTPTPVRVEYPLGKHKRDAPTGGGDPAQTLAAPLQALLNNSINGTLPEDPMIPFPDLPTDGMTLCYRNVILVMLLNLKPFVNYLHLAANQPTDTQNSLSMLKRIFDIHWDRTRSARQRTIDIASAVDAWWQLIHGSQVFNAQLPVASWDSVMGVAGQADPVDFLSYCLDRAHNGELQGDSPMLTIIRNEQMVLFQLFRTRLVQRWAYECDCNEKQRQPFGPNDTDMWCISIQADSNHTALTTLLARYMYDHNDALKRTCPSCNSQNIEVHVYNKFKFLPEIFLIGVTNLTIGPRGNLQINRTANIDTPDMLDLTYLQDYRPNSGNKDNADDQYRVIYRLQAVIAYRGGRGGQSGHYNILVRRDDNTWTSVDEQQNPSVVDGLTGPRVRSGFIPRMLAYVRLRQPSSDVVNTQPATNTQTIDKAATASPRAGQVSRADGAANARSSSPLSSAQDVSSPRQTPQASQQNQNGDNSVLSYPDATDWSATRLRTEMTNMGINIGRTRAKARLLTLWNNYHGATVDGRLSFLLKPRLVQIASDAGLKDMSQSSKPAVIMAIVNHRRLQAAQVVARAPAVSQQNQQPAGDTATVAQLTADKTRLQGEINRLNSADAQLNSQITQLNNQVSQLTQQNAMLTQQLVEMGQHNTRLTAERDAYATQLATLSNQVSSPRQSTTAQTQKPVPNPPTIDSPAPDQPVIAPSPPAGQSPPAAPSTQQQISSVPDTGDSLDPASDSAQPATMAAYSARTGTPRVLKVTATGVIDSLEHDTPWFDHHKYLAVPNYISTQHLVTSQWWHIHQHSHNNSQDPQDMQHSVRVYVAVRGQHGTTPSRGAVAETVYYYDIGLGPVTPDIPTPTLDVELLTEDAARNVADRVGQDVTVLRAPIPVATLTPNVTAAASTPTPATTPAAPEATDAVATSPASEGSLRRRREHDDDDDNNEMPPIQRRKTDEGNNESCK